MQRVRLVLTMVAPRERPWTPEDAIGFREEVKQVGGETEDVLLHDAELMVAKIALKRPSRPGLEGSLQSLFGEKLAAFGWCECASDNPLPLESILPKTATGRGDRIFERNLGLSITPPAGGMDV